MSPISMRNLLPNLSSRFRFLRTYQPDVGESLPSDNARESISPPAPPRKRTLICSRVGDEISQPGRARSIWALNTARAVEENGYEAWLLGRSSNLEYDVTKPWGLRSLRRHVEGIYGINATMKFVLSNVALGFVRDFEGEWEFASGFLAETLAQVDYAHVRDPRVLPLCAELGIPFVYEDHNESHHLAIARNEIEALSSGSCKAVVAITPAVGTRLVEMGVSQASILVEDSGVNLGTASRNVERLLSWRRFLCQESYDAIAFYGGGLQAERGIDQILGAANLLPKVLFVIAGGTERDQESTRSRRSEAACRNVKVCGYLDQATFREIAQAGDVLLFTRMNNDRVEITS